MGSRRQALAGELGLAMQAYQRSTQAFDDEVGRVLDVNPVDLRCLDWLTEGPLSASHLAEKTGLSAAATTSMIDRLERSGFVRRRKHDTDRRQVLVEMTDDGRARTWELYGPLVAAGAPLLGAFTVAQLEAMRDHLVAITGITDIQRERLRAGLDDGGDTSGRPDHDNGRDRGRSEAPPGHPARPAR